MIIICPCCEKKFEIDENLIPEEGRLLQCGPCNQTWFLNKKNQQKTNKFTLSSFFSYFLVLIITFIALIILLDTLEGALIKLFPNLELILFNLFESLKDLSLFILDLK